MAAPYRTARSELRDAETAWRAAPRARRIDLEDQLDRLPVVVSAAIIAAGALIFWACVFWLGLHLGALIP